VPSYLSGAFLLSHSFVFPQRLWCTRNQSISESMWCKGRFINYHLMGTHSRHILLSEILIKQDSIEGYPWCLTLGDTLCKLGE
jgi:hypothetical protein